MGQLEDLSSLVNAVMITSLSLGHCVIGMALSSASSALDLRCQFQIGKLVCELGVLILELLELFLGCMERLIIAAFNNNKIC